MLQDRKERFSKSEQQNIYPLTSRIRCSECGSFYRRKVRNGAIKWVCAKHNADTHTCPSGYYSEERIYDGFITMVNKLRFGEERILDQVIAKLETAATLYKRNNTSAGKMSQSIAELNAKLVMLEQLRSKGYLAIEVYQSQARDIQKQISDLKSQRRSAFESTIQNMLDEVLTLPSRVWEHLNVWDCSYKMEFDSAEVSQIIVRSDGKFHRCIRAKFTDLCYEGIKGEWRPVGSVLFGNASVIETDLGAGIFENLLYVLEDVSDTKEQLKAELNNPARIIFDRICDEVFGDG